jgi:hypothetical protein
MGLEGVFRFPQIEDGVAAASTPDGALAGQAFHFGRCMRVDVSSNIYQVLTDAARMHPQWQFACAKALTDTVKLVQAVMPAFTESALDRPTTFTKTGFYIQPARKDQLVAAVGIKDRQVEYLAYQVEGGVRSPSRMALRLPSVVGLNEYGNLPFGTVRQLVARARAGRRATKRQSQRFGVSSAADLFYGEPGDGRPVGIYKRVSLGAGRQQLVPIVVFPKQPAHYEPRLDFYGEAQRIVEREFDGVLDRAWQSALSTAR